CAPLLHHVSVPAHAGRCLHGCGLPCCCVHRLSGVSVMPLFLSALLGGLIQVAGTLVGRVLISLGIGYVAYQGLDTSLEWVGAQIAASVGDLPAQGLAILGALKVGSAVSVLLSALAAKLVLSGMTGGTIRRMVQK